MGQGAKQLHFMINAPLVSVLMPAYNSGKYIAESIESILNQTFTDFELIIVNDGSTDNTVGIITQYLHDKRVKLFHNEKNKGLAYTRNKCLELAHGTFLANLDSDDIALPDRLVKQIEVMQKYPNVGVCCSWFEYFGGEENSHFICETQKEQALIKIELLFGCIIGNSTVMLRADVLKQNKLNYHADYPPCEDYHVWSQLITHTAFYTIPEILVKYRTHPENTSSLNLTKSIVNRENIIFSQFKKLNIIVNSAEIKIIDKIMNKYNMKNSAFDIIYIHNLFIQIIDNNKQKNIYNQKYLYDFLYAHWKRIINLPVDEYKISFLYKFLITKFSIINTMNLSQLIKFITKSILHWKTRT